MTLSVAIIGRPNVGKSTLFNRLIGKKLALVDDSPGVTRDRREGDAALGGAQFHLIDTAGLDDAGKDELLQGMGRQTQLAINDADVLIFMIDARSGVTPIDEHFADDVRKMNKPIILAANKAESSKAEAGALEAYALGLGTPIAISAEHGQGLGELYDALEPYLARFEDRTDGEEDEDRPLSMAIVGRPNAGKSTLINRLIGEDRLLASAVAGTTRDAIAVEWQWNGEPIKLVDTAGLRKRARVREKLEKLSVADTLRALRYAEVVVLVIDALKPFDKQDLQIADLVAREGRALVIAVNKWDLVDNKAVLRSQLLEQVENLLPQLRGVELVMLSALTGRSTAKLMPAVLRAHKAWNSRVTTAKLNKWLDHAISHHNPPSARGRRIKLRYITQAKSRPPTFIVFCSQPEALPTSYTRYLVNDLRDTFDIPAVPIRLHLRKGENPYVQK